MKFLLCVTMILAGIIHLMPVSGVLGADALAALYGMPFEDRNLQILMRHRAILFGIVGGLLLYGAYDPRLRSAAILVGLLSAVSFLVVAFLVGGYNALLERVVRADIVAVLCLLVAGLLHLRLTMFAPDPHQ